MVEKNKLINFPKSETNKTLEVGAAMEVTIMGIPCTFIKSGTSVVTTDNSFDEDTNKLVSSTTMIDDMKLKTLNKYDEKGNLISTETNTESLATFKSLLPSKYDKAKNNNKAISQFEYDNKNRVIKAVYPDRTEIYTYPNNDTAIKRTITDRYVHVDRYVNNELTKSDIADKETEQEVTIYNKTNLKAGGYKEMQINDGVKETITYQSLNKEFQKEYVVIHRVTEDYKNDIKIDEKVSLLDPGQCSNKNCTIKGTGSISGKTYTITKCKEKPVVYTQVYSYNKNGKPISILTSNSKKVPVMLEEITYDRSMRFYHTYLLEAGKKDNPYLKEALLSNFTEVFMVEKDTKYYSIAATRSYIEDVAYLDVTYFNSPEFKYNCNEQKEYSSGRTITMFDHIYAKIDNATYDISLEDFELNDMLKQYLKLDNDNTKYQTRYVIAKSNKDGEVYRRQSIKSSGSSEVTKNTYIAISQQIASKFSKYFVILVDVAKRLQSTIDTLKTPKE